MRYVIEMNTRDPMEGVFEQTDAFGDTTTSFICPAQTNKLTEDMSSRLRVFGPQQLNLSREDTIADHVVISDKTQETVVDVGNKRPRRSAAIQATHTIKQVLKWERCSESSTLFKNVDHEINQEFDRFTSSGCGAKNGVVDLVASVSDSNNISMGPATTTSTSFAQPQKTELVSGIASDDECYAFKSDAEDGDDDDCDDSDDEAGSLASFVVDDDYISDEDETEKHCKKTKYESQSESGSESGGASSDDEDESVQYDDDSDTDVSDESESGQSTDLVSDVANDTIVDVGFDVRNVETGCDIDVDIDGDVGEDVGEDVGGDVGGGIGGDISTNGDVDMSESHDLMHVPLQNPVWVPFEPDISIWLPEEPNQVVVQLDVTGDESPANIGDFFM